MDLRLVLPAGTVWAATALGLVAGTRPLVGAGLAAAVVCAGGVVAVVRGWLSWRVAGLVVVAAGLLAATTATMALRQDHRFGHPLYSEQGKVVVVATLDGDPVRAGPEHHGRVRVALTVEAVSGDAVAAGRASLSAPAQSWSGLLPGQQVTALVRVRPPPRATLEVASLVAAGPPRLLGAPPVHQRVAGHIRTHLRSNSFRALGSAPAGLLPGLVIGDTSGLDPALEQDFRAAGLTHLTAVSGANFAIVCGAAILLVRGLGAPPWLSAVVGIAVILGFVVLVRPSPSVVRAAIMGGIGLLALLTARRSQALPALGAAVIGGLLWWPELTLAPGFALSVAATAGLVVLAPGLRDWLRRHRVPGGLAEVLAMATSAQVVTAPIVAMVAGTFSPAGIAANLLVAPVVAVISIVGTLAALIGALGPAGGIGTLLAELLLRALGPQLWWMISCARVLGGHRWSQVEVPDGIAGAVLIAGVTTAAALALRGTFGGPSH